MNYWGAQPAGPIHMPVRPIWPAMIVRGSGCLRLGEEQMGIRHRFGHVSFSHRHDQLKSSYAVGWKYLVCCVLGGGRLCLDESDCIPTDRIDKVIVFYSVQSVICMSSNGEELPASTDESRLHLPAGGQPSGPFLGLRRRK